MNDELCKTFERVAKKMGWMNEGGLDAAEKKLMNTIGKTRHSGRSGLQSTDAMFSGSSEDEFDKFLVEKFTPRAKTCSQKPRSAAKATSSNIVVVSSDDDDTFETFLQRVKTPTTKVTKTKDGSDDSLKNFIVDDDSSDDDFIKTKSTFKVPKKKSDTPAAPCPFRKPLSEFNAPVFVSDSEEDDDSVVIKSTWKIRRTKPQPSLKPNNNTEEDKSDDENCSPSPPLPPSPFLLTVPPSKTQPSVPKRILSAPSRLDESTSSEEEFASLLDRLKKKNNLTSTSFSPKTTKESTKEPAASATPVRSFATPSSKSVREKPPLVKTPGKFSIPTLPASQSEPRHIPSSRVALCKTPGCFLESLTNPGSSYGVRFKKNKEEVTSKLYQLYNSSVFDNKLPTNMSVTWNKKMRKTAGYCITGQEKGGEKKRYARIELSEKVCDSADRLRDTLIHEMCHSATWLINGVRDGHGAFWKLYARKATLVHPELPMVTRCHSYDIKYKFEYQCSRCQNTIGRHSKSLDTQRFVCALCTGQLVLLTPSKTRAPTPFANFVKENYGTVRQELAGQSHAEVMRKLSADFASKTKLS